MLMDINMFKRVLSVSSQDITNSKVILSMSKLIKMTFQHLNISLKLTFVYSFPPQDGQLKSEHRNGLQKSQRS